METYTITLDDGSTYLIKISFEEDRAVYETVVENQKVRFIGNPDWDTGGAFIIPESPPVELDLILLEEIAEKIENNTL